MGGGGNNGYNANALNYGAGQRGDVGDGTSLADFGFRSMERLLGSNWGLGGGSPWTDQFGRGFTWDPNRLPPFPSGPDYNLNAPQERHTHYQRRGQ